MAPLTRGQIHLDSLRENAHRLAHAAEFLAAHLGQEAERLRRSDQVARLKTLRSAVLEEAEREMSNERSRKIGYNAGKTAISLVGLGSRLLAGALGDTQLADISQRFAHVSQTKGPPFGIVLISIGPDGLPQDVCIVCISRLARDAKRKEAAVIGELKQQRHLLLSVEAFTLLIDKLMHEITSGTTSLPVSVKELARFQAPVPPTPGAGRLTGILIEPMPARPRDE